jgi:3-deoxy-7-phosphoheptulonate synthase
MILILSPQATEAEVQELMVRLRWMGLRVTSHVNEEYRCLAVIGAEDKSVDFESFTSLPLVERVMPFRQPYKLAGRQIQQQRAVFDIGPVRIGGSKAVVMAGPCTIESAAQVHATAEAVALAGADILRGGAFKPRTSPYSFQGLGEEGLILLREAADAHGLITVSEVMDTVNLDRVAQHVDILQVGARNMQNFSLLKALGELDKPVLLKRGMSATYKDLLMAAEYLLSGGNERVILCERGIRTFESYARNTLDIAAVPILHELSHLPVIVDPSHGTGLRRMVAPLARAAVAAGADGLMIEVHPDPDRSVSDAEQTISLEAFEELMESLRLIAPAVGRQISARREIDSAEKSGS